ncbi:MBL fold metallo-hydrolase [Desulforegula conservatrix]|uniref:MBL fold metallo-hydrolase n=1 Tax=Desulforegula conservatrix TaxID=153026 RepID=UPI000416092B|nr:MBL fold metallo-hydrolase [Desulforegula conservatrix]
MKKRPAFFSAIIFLTGILSVIQACQHPVPTDNSLSSPSHESGETDQNTPQRSKFSALMDYFVGGAKRIPDTSPGPFSTDLNALNKKQGDGLQITWLGHSTVLMTIEGKRFLTDPVWSRRCSPVSFMGPKRFFEAPIRLKDLPKLDAILISHDHYDHLDKETILFIANNTDTPFYMPYGVGKHFRDWGVPEKRINEYRWWDEIKLGNTHTLALTPARHFSGRTLFDRNSTLWASWVIMGKEKKVYFGGDSGMFPGFSAIGEKYGPFDITMLEIGAFDKAWSDIHLGPLNAIKAHKMLNGKTMMPIHWGTFNLALHAWDEPIETLISTARSEDCELFIPTPGKIYGYHNLTAYSMWWREKTEFQAQAPTEPAEVEAAN